MTKADIVNEVSELTGLTKVETETVLEGVIESIVNALSRSERIDIRGFGSFQVKKRKAREARNPATQELLRLDERYVPVFKVSNLLKEKINKTILQ
jgi:DNA-binding protein HU-beta